MRPPFGSARAAPPARPPAGPAHLAGGHSISHSKCPQAGGPFACAKVAPDANHVCLQTFPQQARTHLRAARKHFPRAREPSRPAGEEVCEPRATGQPASRPDGRTNRDTNRRTRFKAARDVAAVKQFCNHCRPSKRPKQAHRPAVGLPRACFGPATNARRPAAEGSMGSPGTRKRLERYIRTGRRKRPARMGRAR